MEPNELIQAVNILSPLLALFYCVWMLVRYELKRRWPKDRYTGKLKWIQANIVEIFIFLMFVAIAVPNWGTLLFDKIP